MKTKIYKYFLLLGFTLFLWACSTKKDTFFNRQYQALNTKYNALYNGNIALDKGYYALIDGYHDNFWEVLPIERMQLDIEKESDVKTEGDKEKGNPEFGKAEDKATKVIQKRSMYIGGREKNSQIDEAYLLLGKARYYDQRFIPALEAFNYILYKYPDSDKINEAKVWREKTNLRLMYDELALQNLKEMLKDKKLKGQNKADALSTTAQAYLNLGYKDSAVTKLVEAKNLTKRVEEKARFDFILGQLYGRLGKNELAKKSFQDVIDMKRSAPRIYTIQSHIGQFEYDNKEKSDTVAFLKKYNKLIEDRENKSFLDLLYRQVAIFYLKNDNPQKAIGYFEKSLKNDSNKDNYLKALNYKNLAEIYFEDAKYEMVGKYYDSTLVVLPQKTKEYFQITRKRDNIKDVLMYERSANTNDSLLSLIAMSDVERNTHISKLIEKLKKDDAKKLALESKANNAGQSQFAEIKNPMSGGKGNTSTIGSTGGKGGASSFYFYSSNAVSFGKIEFKKRWGNRSLKDNWRWGSSTISDVAGKSNKDETDKANVDNKGELNSDTEFRYSVDFYKNQIPTDPKEIESIKKDRDFAYFQLGSIYNEKFNKLELAVSKFENLLSFKPEERLVLPAKYNLYKIYLIIDPSKAEKWKQNIITEHSESRYAELLLNKSISAIDKDSPENIYDSMYKLYEKGEYPQALLEVNKAINHLVEGDYISKFELLKANIIGKLEGLESYKEVLNYISLTYAGKAEAKEAERILNKDLPKLNNLKLTEGASKNWKIIYPIPVEDLEKASSLERRLRDYALNLGPGVKFSKDYYTADKVFFVLHGINSEQKAMQEMEGLNSYSEYKGVVISSENYAVVQIKKEWDKYLKIKQE